MMMTRIQSSPSQQRMQQNARRVSFEDTDKPSSKRRFVGLTGGSQRSRGIYSTSCSNQTAPTHSPAAPSLSPTLKKNQVTVLHGRVMKDQQQQQQLPMKENSLRSEAIEASTNNNQRRSLTKRLSDMSIERTFSRHQFNSSMGGASIRDLLERKAVYAKLLDETKHFQEQVSTLENVLKKEHQPPSVSTTTSTIETGWRVRLLLKKAQDTDTTLWRKLYEYEKTLLDVYQNQTTGSTNEIRDLQTSCMKLHRDFKRCHKALLMCLSLLGDEDKNQLMNDITDPENSAITSPIVDAVGWTGMMTTIDKRENIRNIDSVMLRKSDNDLDISNNKLDEDGSLSRSISPIPAYTSFRKEKETGRDSRKPKQKKIIDYDEYDEFPDDDYNICQDKFFDALTNYCSTSRCHGTPSRRNDNNDNNVDDDDPHLFWICSDILDLAHTDDKAISNTNSSAKNQTIDCHVDKNNNKRTTTIADTDDVMYNNNDDNESFTSTKYKWFQQIQDNVHSMQLDLLRFRSRSLNRHHNYDDIIDDVPEYNCGGGNDGETNHTSTKAKGWQRNNISDDISSTCNSSDAPLDES